MNDKIIQLNSCDYLCKLFQGDALSRDNLDKIEEEINRLDDETKQLVLQEISNSQSVYDFHIIENRISLKVKENKNVEFNKKLRGDLYDWKDDGDEWNDMAEYDGVTYEDWKNGLVDNFIQPYIGKNKNILEIAVGHGRWSEYLLKLYNNYYGIDISNECISYCREKFSKYDNCNFILGNGVTFDSIESNTIDFVFSFDSFVHISQNIFIGYLKEISRVLLPGGICIIHHSGVENKNQIKNAGYRASCSTNVIYNEASKNNLKLINSLKTRGSF